uniref:Uncharacterized protein n=1 Tax=Psilocybe cubensis TaxID=181762 RepID=A0A8H7XVN2_PSICU
MSRSIPLEYNLPSNIESIQQGWTRTCQASMMISCSLAILAPIFLIFFKDSQGGALALEVFGYSAFFLNVSACMSSFIMIDRLGDMPWHACQKPDTESIGKIVATQQQTLRRFGVGALWPWVAGHWLLCFALGYLAIIAEILTYVWMNKSTEVKVASVMFAIFGLLPFFAFAMAPIVNGLIEIIFPSDNANSITTRSSTPFVVEIPQSPVDRQRRTTGQSSHTPTTPYRPNTAKFPVLSEKSNV